MGSAPSTVHEIRCAQRADELATMLGIGTPNPPTCRVHEDYLDWYFHVTNSEHQLTDLKNKRTGIYNKSGIRQRYMLVNDEVVAANPNFIDCTRASQDKGMDITSVAVPELATTAAAKAIAEWGRPTTDITHLIFSIYSGTHAPSGDYHLASLLGLL